MFRGRVRRIHLVGIGGVGMSGIAEVLIDYGFEVSGSDQKDGENIQRLKKKGAQISTGHQAQNAKGADVVVYSTAVKFDNPELIEARKMQIPVIRRAEMLAELMRLKEGIAIAGSHGKTTTTSLVSTVLRGAGLDPTVIIGGKLNALGSVAARGAGELLVAEADESDGSFLHLTPTIAVITNIDPEHLDHFGTLENVKNAFITFANRVPFYGLVVACLDHPHVQDILPSIERRVVTYGLSAQADYRALKPAMAGLSVSFEVERRGEALGRYEVRMPGMHNVLNALATIIVADELQVPHDKVRSALRTFEGVDRRFSVRGEHKGIVVIDDYGHHPAEIEATLEAAARAYGRRIVVAFQPHRYSRTRDLFDELKRAFNRADVLFVSDVYAAGEDPIPGADSQHLVEAISAHGHRSAHYVPKRSDLAAELVKQIESDDIVITLGAGDITRTANEVLDLLRK